MICQLLYKNVGIIRHVHVIVDDTDADYVKFELK